jgi:flagellar basal body P-ring formation protein FlgA
MRSKAAIATLALAALCATCLAGVDGLLRVYLPREVRIARSALTLGSICVIRCQDPAIRKKAEAVSMGRAPFTGEQIVIDRTTVRGRLAASGIPTQLVRLTGAETVAVHREEQVIQAQRILEEAEKFLQANQPGSKGCGWRIARAITDLTIPGEDEISLTVRPVAEPAPGYFRLEIAATCNEEVLGNTQVLYKLTYPHQEATAKTLLPAGTVLTPGNVEIRTVQHSRPSEADWAAPYGMETTRDLPAGTVLRTGLVRDPHRPAVVRRNELVTMAIRRPGFTVSTTALALQDGRSGDFVRVRNVDTRRVVVARVCHDGTVEPTMER